MKVGIKDRMVRILLGMVLLWVGVHGQLPLAWRMVSLAIGSVTFVTGLIRFFPVWGMFRSVAPGK